jgi:phosphate starvation-inducible PhoH-like protein
MLPQSHPDHVSPVTDIPFPERGVSALFNGQPSLAASIEEAVRPFRLNLRPWSEGIRVAGDHLSISLACEVLTQLGAALEGGRFLNRDLVAQVTSTAIAHHLRHNQVYHLPGIPHPLRPLCLSQVAFLDGILSSGHNLIFGVGPTGTGKTYLAVAAGLNLVAEGHFRKLIITRPHVLLEGETMTPAMRADTVYDDQLASIEDALTDLLGHDEMRRRIEHGVVEVVPLGKLRGRTFNECIVVIDEAQNLSVRKMRMALTRMGRACRMIVTGDPEQSDLPDDEVSGLRHILPLIAEADLALIHRFDESQIVRNEIVAKIEALYGRDDETSLRFVA